MLTSAFLLAAVLPQGPLPQVKINEFVYDHSGTDLDEFIELYNAGSTPVDISGWMIDGEGTTSSNFDFVIPANTPSIPAGGFFLIANAVAQSPTLLAANALVSGAPSGGWLQNGKDSIILRDASMTVVDAVTYENSSGGTLVSSEQIEGAGIRGAVNNFGYAAGTLNYNGFSRLTDGFDTDDNGRDFRIARATPGASNDFSFDVTASSYVLDGEIAINGLTAGSTLPMWGASCQLPELEAYVALPPSPIDDDGTGNPLPGSLYARFGCQAANDSIGGSVWLETAPASNYTFEAFVYFETALTAMGTGEYWHIGFQGTSAEFFNVPASIFPAQNFGADVTGAGLSYVVDESGANVYLMDYSNGDTETVLATLPITQTGWQRVRVQVAAGAIEARVGGTPLAMDGTVLSGSIDGDGAFGGLYIGYRKSGATMIGVGRTESPLYMDGMLLTGSNAMVDCFGTPTPNTVTTPVLGASLPYIGNANFGLQASGLLPSAPYFQLYGIGFPGDIGLDVSTVLPTPPGLTLWVQSNILGSTLVSDAQGEGTYSLPLPSSATLIGLPLWGQVFQTDPGLGVAIPLSATKAVRTTIGSF